MKKWIVPAALVLMLALAACAPACVSERAPAGERAAERGRPPGPRSSPMGEGPGRAGGAAGAHRILRLGPDHPVLVGERQLEQSGTGWGGGELDRLRPPPLDSQEYPVLYTGIPGAGQTEGGGWPPSPRR